MIILEVIFLLFFFAAPVRAKIVLFIIKLFIPDPFLYVDDVIMLCNIVTTIYRVGIVFEFIKEHKFVSFLCGIIGFALIYKVAF